MANPATALGKYFTGPQIQFQDVDKWIAKAQQTVSAIVDSEYFWMTASVTLLCTIDWALKHALLGLVEGI